MAPLALSLGGQSSDLAMEQGKGMLTCGGTVHLECMKMY